MPKKVSFGKSNWVDEDLCTQVDGKWVLKSKPKKKESIIKKILKKKKK